ncbi:MAG: hypothetical protein ACYDHY_06855 [Acidiferrobacterales bacterium]
MNTSVLSDDETARTEPEVAIRRAENLAILGVKSVLELCVGPSLKVLQAAYFDQGITCCGNDFEKRWQEYYPKGHWRIGDALAIPWDREAVVFAPPVSRGCTGRRVDSLRIWEVKPSYSDFLKRFKEDCCKTAVLVLPARSLATRFDRKDLYRLLARAGECGKVELYEQLCGRRCIRKYVEIYLEKR